MKTRVPKSECPACKQGLDAATEFQGADVSPTPGDVSICQYCAALNEFADDLQLRPISPELEQRLFADPVDAVRVRKIVARIKGGALR